MYFTIPGDQTSITPLSPEALGAYQRLRQEAKILGDLSASFAGEAQVVTAAFSDALTEGDARAWASFVRAADSLVRHSDDIAGIVQLDARERAAYDYFAQIARENADLLPTEHATAA